MTKRLTYRLILLLLCLTGWQTPTHATESLPSDDAAIATIEGTSDNTPQWQDLGMCDILAVTGGSTLTPPSTVRVIHDNPAGTTPVVQAAASRHYCVKRLLTRSHHHIAGGYIYLIRCLRL